MQEKTQMELNHQQVILENDTELLVAVMFFLYLFFSFQLQDTEIFSLKYY